MSTFSLFPEDPIIQLQVTLDWPKQQITFDWKQIELDKKLGHGAVWVTGDLLRWRITGGGETDDYCSPIDPVAVEYNLKYLAQRFPVAKRDVSVSGRRFNFILNRWEREPIKKAGQTWQFLAGLIVEMGQQLAGADSTSISPEPLLDPKSVNQAEKRARREQKQRLQRQMIQSRVAEANRRNRERQVAPHSLAFNPTADKYVFSTTFPLDSERIYRYTRLYCGFDSAIEIFDVNRPGEGTRLLTSPNKKSRDGMKGEFPTPELSLFKTPSFRAPHINSLCFCCKAFYHHPY